MYRADRCAATLRQFASLRSANLVCLASSQRELGCFRFVEVARWLTGGGDDDEVGDFDAVPAAGRPRDWRYSEPQKQKKKLNTAAPQMTRCKGIRMLPPAVIFSSIARETAPRTWLGGLTRRMASRTSSCCGSSCDRIPATS